MLAYYICPEEQVAGEVSFGDIVAGVFGGHTVSIFLVLGRFTRTGSDVFCVDCMSHRDFDFFDLTKYSVASSTGTPGVEGQSLGYQVVS